MKEKHPGLPTIRAIPVLYMIICAVGSRFYPVDPVHLFPIDFRYQPQPTWMDRIHRMKAEETTNLRNYEKSGSHKNAFILPILCIHVSCFFEVMEMCANSHSASRMRMASRRCTWGFDSERRSVKFG